MSDTKVILVLGATGKQGGGVVKALAETNASSSSSVDAYKILAVTRSAPSAKAQALLSQRGTVLVEGNLDRPAELFESAKAHGPVYGVFSVAQSFDNASGGVEAEVKQGKALADEALKAGVKHFVYTSVDQGGLPSTDVPHFESKRKVEEYLRNVVSVLPTTILRPTFFMDNLGADGLGSMQYKLMSSALLYNFSDESKTIQMIACSDIGKYAAKVFENPQTYIGKTVSLAGDAPTMAQLQSSFRSVMGSDIPTTYGFLGSALKWGVKDLGTMFKFFDKTGYTADIPALRNEMPALKTWEQFLQTEVKPNAA